MEEVAVGEGIGDAIHVIGRDREYE